MQYKHLQFMIWSSMKAQRRIWAKNAVVMGLACALLFGTGAFSGSMNTYYDERVRNTPCGRTIMAVVATQDKLLAETVFPVLMAEDSKIVDFYSLPRLHSDFSLSDALGYMPAGYSNTSKSFGRSVGVQHRALEKKYLVDGRWINDTDTHVVVVPKKFSLDKNSVQTEWNSTADFIDGETLLGKTLSYSYYTFRTEGNELVIDKTFAYPVKVIGTYDNIAAGMDACEVVIPYLDVVEITDVYEANTLEPDSDGGILYNILVDKEENVDAVISQLNDALSGYAFEGYQPDLWRKMTPGGLMDLVPLVSWLGKALSTGLLTVSFVMILTMLSKSIRERSREFGLYKAIGYRNGHIVTMILLESVTIGAAVFMITAMGCMLLAKLATWYVLQYGSIYFNSFRMAIQPGDLLYGMVLCLLVPVMASFLGIRFAISVDPKQALSKGRE